MHLHLVGYGGKDHHERFIKAVNSWEYEAEGEVFKGTTTPYVSEVKFYDVRIKEEVAGQFLRDMGAYMFTEISPKTGSMSARVIVVTKFFIPLIRKILGYKTIKKEKGPKKHSLIGWFHAFFIGAIKDGKLKDKVTGAEKEFM